MVRAVGLVGVHRHSDDYLWLKDSRFVTFEMVYGDFEEYKEVKGRMEEDEQMWYYART